ncbi:hypothetical protein AVEN_240164-1 [Araneus ventricosus]|uniref:DUF4817 domain-containing protein n=1 Tax=Araneus ventricosus TaxID=182803 RepID=A0A4Y2KX27_ARAVE|nr:hypothetical protein AVEN_240164-1 [Araneus ventricosus]
MGMERYTCSPETTTIKRMFLQAFTLKLRVMTKFGIKEYCEMLLIYGECGRKAKSAARLYRERFPEGPHPTWQTILKVVKRLRETGRVTNRPGVRRLRNVGLKVQPEDVLAYALPHPQSSTNMISENCGLSKSRVWTILNESGAHPFRSIPVQGLLPRDPERRYMWCNFVMNNLDDHPTFLADIIWTDEACFSLIERTFIPGRWKIRDMLSNFDINYAGRLMFGTKFLMTGSLDQYFTRDRQRDKGIWSFCRM